jgi:hypothetical protein
VSGKIGAIALVIFFAGKIPCINSKRISKLKSGERARAGMRIIKRITSQ